MSRQKLLTVHGKKARTPFSELIEDGGCRPVCPTCDTGMVCASNSSDHYCVYGQCPDNDRQRFMREYPR